MKKRSIKKSVRRRRRMVSKPVARRRRRRGMSEDGILSEFFNPQTAKAAAQVVGAGAVGGFLAGGVSKVVANQPFGTRLAVEFGASFVTYALLGYPNMAAGMAGAFAAGESQNIYSKFLNEDGAEYADDSALNELPYLMNEDGDTITLQQDGSGSMVYLNESTGETTLAEEVYLNESVYLQEDDGIYPNYAVEY
jgi:hypothetical protein